MRNKTNERPSKPAKGGSPYLGDIFLVGFIVYLVVALGFLIVFPYSMLGLQGFWVPVLAGLVFVVIACVAAFWSEGSGWAPLLGLGIILLASGAARGIAFASHSPQSATIGLLAGAGILVFEVFLVRRRITSDARRVSIRAEFLALPLDPVSKANLLNALDAEKTLGGKESILRDACAKAGR